MKKLLAFIFLSVVATCFGQVKPIRDAQLSGRVTFLPGTTMNGTGLTLINFPGGGSNLPDPTGHPLQFLQTDGVSFLWNQIPFSQLSGTPTTLAGYGIVIANNTLTEAMTVNLVNDLASKALDSAVMHNTGAENENGLKTFGSVPMLPAQSPGAIFGVPASALSSQTPVFFNLSIASIFGTTAQIGYANNVYVSIRGDGKTGSGSPQDPFDGSTQAKFISALNSVSPGGILHVAQGLYPAYVLTISQSVMITGPRDAIFTQLTGSGSNPIFTVSGSTTDFWLDGVTLQHGDHFFNENNVTAIINSGTIDSIRLTNILATDFTSTVIIQNDNDAAELYVASSDFKYTHGRASCSSPSPFTSPCAPIVGHPTRLIVYNCTFDGLLDPTFTGVQGNPPNCSTGGGTTQCQEAAADNFIQVAPTTYVDISTNTVRNNGIEGIVVARTSPSGTYSFSVTNNHIVGTTYDPQPPGGYFGGYSPGISIHNARVTIAGNTIDNIPLGIDLIFTSQSDANNVVSATNNTMSHVINGIQSTNGSKESKYSNNVIWNTSEPVHTVFGSQAFPQMMCGLKLDRGMATNNTLISDEPVWDASTTLNSRSNGSGCSNGNVFAVTSGTGIVSGGALISYTGGYGIAFFPVTSVSGNNVTVDCGYAGAYSNVTSGSIFFAQNYPNFGIAAAVSIVTGGNIIADGNVISGHAQDFAETNSGTITIGQNVARSCHLIEANSATFIRGNVGISDGVAATAGTWGEEIHALVPSGLGEISLSNGTAANVTSISLTPGDWMVGGNVNFDEASATVTQAGASSSITSATLAGDGSETWSGLQTTTSTQLDSVTIAPRTVNVTTTTTIYLVAKCSFSAGTVKAYGSIRARRISR